MSKKNWIIPKGIVESGLSAADSAMQEAYEEAGIEGQIEGKCIGNYSYDKWGGKCEVEVYACLVTKVLTEWPEMIHRKRAWYTPKDAIAQINNKDLKKILKKFIADRAD